MAMTTSTLLRWRNVDPVDAAGFKRAGAVASAEYDSFLPVLTTLGAGVVWSGAGQPQATNVATNNSQALEIARIRMDSGAIAVTGLVTAMNALRANLDGLVEHAKSRKWKIGENGDVVPTQEDPDYNPEEVQHLRVAVQNTLKLASAADLATRGSLLTVTQGTPFVSDTATEGNPNAAGIDDALEDRTAVQQVSAPLLVLGDEVLISADDIQAFLDKGVSPNDVEAQLGTLDEILGKFAEYAIGKLPNGGPVLAALSGDLSKVLNATIELAIQAGVMVSGSALLTRVFSRASGAAGVLLLAGDVLSALWKEFSTPDSAPDAYDVVDLNGNVITTVGDPDLERLAHQYHLPEGNADPGDDGRDSLAEIVHKQRADGFQEGDTARVQEAEQLRADLLQWMASHDASEADAAYAYSLVLELDFALGNPPTP